MAELEQLIAADLTHPAIVTPIATGVAGVTAYLAQDFVAAESLDTHLREHRAASAPSEVVRVIAQVAAALDVAASGRIVHGALHPRDLLVSSDDVRVTGLGIARALERVGITAPVRRPYTAPERVGGRAWDRRADVFSLAVLAYEMLWGRRPSASGARAADGVTDIPGADLEALRAVFVRAMAETFTDRFDSAERFVDALRGALGRAADAVEAEPVLTDRMRSTSPIDAIDAIVPVDAAEPIDTAARGDDGRLFDLDQFRRADAIERFQPEGPASNVLPGPFPPAEKGTADEEEIKSGVEALSDSTETAGEPPVQEPRAPRKVVRSEADRRPKTRERPPAPDVRGARAESSLFREPAEAVPTPAPANAPAPPAAAPALADTGRTEEVAFASVDRARSALWPLAMALGVGVALGFAVGFGVGGRQRDQSPVAPAETLSAPAPANTPGPGAGAAPSVQPRPSDAPAAPAVTPPAPAAAEVQAPPPAVQPTPPPTPPAAPASRPAAAAPRTAAPRAPAPAPRPARPAPARPAAAAPDKPAAASLAVDSRPSGANVYIDGKLIGTTPLLLPSLAAGDHAVRIELAGYNRWSATVGLEGGERRRVAASLEQ